MIWLISANRTQLPFSKENRIYFPNGIIDRSKLHECRDVHFSDLTNSDHSSSVLLSMTQQPSWTSQGTSLGASGVNDTVSFSRRFGRDSDRVQP